jgi:1,4-dihydroxy-2-naphthoate octaprenyltransferase
MGLAMAWGDGAFHAWSAAGALLGAVLIQIGTNFVNDYYDFKKGADTAERIGPVRVTQAGLVTPAGMRRAIGLVFALAAVDFILLTVRGGWPIGLIGALALLCAFLYTAGPYPLGYKGLGDVFVLVFFGPVAVGGTYWLQMLDLSYLPLLAGLAPGLLSVAILTVNNLRDVDQDRKTGKRTLAVRFGRGFARVEYLGCVMLASAIPVILFFTEGGRPWSLLASLTVFAAWPAARRVLGETAGPPLNEALALSGKLVLIFSVLFSVGWLAP